MYNFLPAGDIIGRANGELAGMEGDDEEGEGGEGWDVDDDLVLPPDLVRNKIGSLLHTLCTVHTLPSVCI